MSDRAERVAVCEHCKRILEPSSASPSGWLHADAGDVFCAVAYVPDDAQAESAVIDGDEA